MDHDSHAYSVPRHEPGMQECRRWQWAIVCTAPMGGGRCGTLWLSLALHKSGLSAQLVVRRMIPKILAVHQTRPRALPVRVSVRLGRARRRRRRRRRRGWPCRGDRVCPPQRREPASIMRFVPKRGNRKSASRGAWQAQQHVAPPSSRARMHSAQSVSGSTDHVLSAITLHLSDGRPPQTPRRKT